MPGSPIFLREPEHAPIDHGRGRGLVAVCDRMGIQSGIDVWKIPDVAEDLVVPIMDFPIRIDRNALTLGYAGVYGSFLLFVRHG